MLKGGQTQQTLLHFWVFKLRTAGGHGCGSGSEGGAVVGVWDLSSGFFLSGRTEEWPGGHGGADVVLHRGDHRQAWPHRVQRVSTHLSSASSSGSVTGAATIKLGALIKLLSSLSGTLTGASLSWGQC